MNRVSQPSTLGDLDRLIGGAQADAERLGDARPSSHVGLGLQGLPVGVLPADFLAGYRLQREIHRGGQGIVYHAVQLSTNQSVAIKVMRSGPLAGSSDEIRFKREVQILAELSHPQIVAVRDTGEAGSLRYLIMDHVDGVPLDAYVERVRPKIKQTLRLFANVCDAVNAAHLRGVIHRDLKPGNILVDDAGTARILDFGLARLVEDDSSVETITHEGQFVGSLPWASPEQAAGEQANIDLRTDVYSLGVILYRLLTGRFPYETQGGMQAVLDRIQHAEPISPRKLGAVFRDARSVSRISDPEHTVSDRDRRSGRIDDEIDTIVRKCLAKDRERRYQSAGELARDLERYLAGEPIEAKRDSLSYVLRKQLRRYRIPAAIAGAFLVVVTVGFVATLWAWQRSEDQRKLAQANAERATQQASKALHEAAKAEAVSNFLQELLETASPNEARGNREITVREALDRAAERIESGGLRDQPAVAAAVRATLGKAYWELGHPEKAEPQLRAALDLKEQLAGPDDAERLNWLNILALLLQEQNRLDEAEMYLSEALERSRRTLGVEHNDVLNLLNSMANMLLLRGKPAEAEQMWTESVAGFRRVFGHDHSHALAPLNNLASLYVDHGRLDEAEPLLRQVLEGNRRAFGDDHPNTLAVITNLSVLLRKQNKPAEAEPLAREALDRARRVWGDDHPRTPSFIQNLAATLQAQGKLPESETLFRESLERRRRLPPDDHPDSANSVNSLATVLEAQGKFSEAEPLRREQLDRERSQQPPNDAILATALAKLAVNLIRQRRFSDAEPALRECLAILERLFAGDHPQAWQRYSAMSLLGESLTGQNKFAQAEPLLIESHEKLRSPPAGNAYSRKALTRIVKLYENWDAAEPGTGKADKAAEWRVKLEELDSK